MTNVILHSQLLFFAQTFYLLVFKCDSNVHELCIRKENVDENYAHQNGLKSPRKRENLN